MDVKAKGIRVNEQQYLCLSSHGPNPKWPSGSMFYDVQEILHQSFPTVLDSHVMDSIYKIGCRPNSMTNQSTFLAVCAYLYVASTFMYLAKRPLM